MPGLLVRHKVEDFAKWFPVYSNHASMRKNGGEKGAHVYRNADDPSEVFILFEWDSIENARAFFASDDLRAAMHDAGVVGKPEASFLNDVEHTSF
jgi:heme-degrading monooxygenase HmoA